MRDPSKADVRATYERIAASFTASRHDPWPEVADFIRTIPSPARVLDVGCGNGRHVSALLDQNARAIGLDFSRSLLLLARQRDLRGLSGPVPWIEGEAEAIPLRDGSVDAVLCVAVLHHLPTVPNRIAALTEIRRVLAPGGRVLVSVWALDQPRFRHAIASSAGRPAGAAGDVEVPWSMPGGGVVSRYYHLFREGELEQLIIESGLHGETFFRSRGNLFVEASNHG